MKTAGNIGVVDELDEFIIWPLVIGKGTAKVSSPFSDAITSAGEADSILA